ncbi:MAG: hypothetical protein RMK75_07880 [Aquificaceae bacterium]|nr:RNA chaperone Hfq [Aquificaceae bacterium]MDW8424219.1 hypothetical protein [Aquificaceae bacterium]
MQKPQRPQKPKQQQEQKRENIHQNLLLKTAHERGWKLRLTFMNGKELEGILVGYDNYTLTLKLPDDRVVCYFKQAFESFEVVVPT